jgi:murein DD-endopeptidase MepM/ murein hydrolase activator NlpD
VGKGSAPLTALAIAAAWMALVRAQGPALSIAVDSRSLQPGELAVVTVDTPGSAAAPRLRAFDREVPVYADGDHRWRALVGIDLDTRPAAYPLVVESGANREERMLQVEPKAFRTRRLTVDEGFVTPPDSVRERIDREAKLLEATWRSSAPERLWGAGFRRPVPQPANSAFGTRSIFNGKPRNAHGGADFLSPGGTPVAAPASGRVAVARALYYSGNTVIIDHGLGVFSMLAHLSAIEVAERDPVAAGALVGKVGATGRVTGPHLHWAVRVGNARVDPLSVLAELGQRQP